MHIVKRIVFIFIFIHPIFCDECKLRNIDKNHKICVCNALHCDTVPPLIKLTENNYQIYSTTKKKLGFVSNEGILSDADVNSAGIITIDDSVEYQNIIGFGGAFTDSTGINIAALNATLQDSLLKSYFSDVGIGYSLCRVPIGSTDFSPRAYSYDDNAGDVNLTKFSLQKEDFDYKINFIKIARKLRADDTFRLFASPWTAPPWMKTNNDWNGIGFLIDDYYQVWADYFIKFFDSYRDNGIEFWGVTLQNEPFTGLLPNITHKYVCMTWTVSKMINFIKNYIGPAIRQSEYSDLKILVHDDSRLTIGFVQFLFDDDATLRLIDGVGVHWYTDFLVPSVFLQGGFTSKKSDIFLLSTEACNGFSHLLDIPIRLGSWPRGIYYFNDIYEDLSQNVSGWIDWNMVLNLDGGPTYTGNNMDAPILVNVTSQEFYKQPSFYVLGHFSKFITPNSVRISLTLRNLSGVKGLAFKRPDNIIVVTLYNSNESAVRIKVNTSKNKSAAIILESNSINTMLYSK